MRITSACRPTHALRLTQTLCEILAAIQHLPFSVVAANTRMRILALVAITIYKKYISPFKGFRCAYGVLYDGNSCSTEIYKIISEHGIFKGFPLAKNQLNQCSTAYRKLSSGKEDNTDESVKKKKPKKKEESNSWCDFPCQCGGGKGGGDGADCDLPFDCSA